MATASCYRIRIILEWSGGTGNGLSEGARSICISETDTPARALVLVPYLCNSMTSRVPAQARSGGRHAAASCNSGAIAGFVMEFQRAPESSDNVREHDAPSVIAPT